MAVERERIRCPACGMVAWPRHLGAAGRYPLEVLAQRGLGRARGWAYRRLPLPVAVARALLRALDLAAEQVRAYIRSAGASAEVLAPAVLPRVSVAVVAPPVFLVVRPPVLATAVAVVPPRVEVSQ